MSEGQLTPALILSAYAAGVFPMAESKDDPTVVWVEPSERGVIPLDDFHAPKRLARSARAHKYTVFFDRDFAATIKACANRDETWINDEIETVFTELHEMGFAHSVETYDENNVMVGGLYGLALGGAFFGESMFSTKTDASKVALVALVERMKEKDFVLLDTQFMTEHLRQFGGLTIPRDDYLRRLGHAIRLHRRF